MGALSSQITSLTIVYSTVYSDADQRKTGEFPAQMASYAENVSIWWRHHDSADGLRFVVAKYRRILQISLRVPSQTQVVQVMQAKRYGK